MYTYLLELLKKLPKYLQIHIKVFLRFPNGFLSLIMLTIALPGKWFNETICWLFIGM